MNKRERMVFLSSMFKPQSTYLPKIALRNSDEGKN